MLRSRRGQRESRAVIACRAVECQRRISLRRRQHRVSGRGRRFPRLSKVFEQGLGIIRASSDERVCDEFMDASATVDRHAGSDGLADSVVIRLDASRDAGGS